MARPRALLFDVFGTLVDWRSSLIREASALRPDLTDQWPAIVDAWRRSYQPAMNDVVRAGGAWRDLDDIQAQTLERVLADAAGVGERITAAERASLVGSWRRLSAWPDVPTGLTELRQLCITSTLSNGHVALLIDLLRYAGLELDLVGSAQLAHSYKPQPIVYLTALELLDIAADEAMLVACHANDLRAAAALGLQTAFVRRPREWGDGGGDQPPSEIPGLIVVEGLPDLAGVLAGMSL